MEIWKELKDYIGIYEISSLGRIKRLAYKTNGKNNSIINRKGNFLNPYKNKQGYLCVRLSFNNKVSNKLHHRLIAENFILNTENKKIVNHKNGIKTDNSIENLEWCTYSENVKHSFQFLKRILKNRSFKKNEVLEIKKLLENHKHGDNIKIAKKYNVSVSIISLIKRKITYKYEG